MNLLILIALFITSHAKEEKKKALIITIDELKPEESDVIISDLTIKEQRNVPIYRSKEESYSPSDGISLHKHQDYILVRPEDLKALKNIADVTVEKPKFLKYPDSTSDEIYETNGYSEHTPEKDMYSTLIGYPHSPGNKYTIGISKYPARPAPPLTVHSSDNGKSNPKDSLRIHVDYSGYHSINPSYKSPDTYTGPQNYITPMNTYTNSNPNSYSGTSNYSSPGSSKSKSYSDLSAYKKSKPIPHTISSYTEIEKLPGHSRPTSYSRPTTYENSKLNTYYRSPTYEKSKPSIYQDHSPYKSSKASSYSDPNTYENSRTGDYYDPSIYLNSKPNSYSRPLSYDNSKSNSYSGVSTYGSAKPSTYSGSSSYERSKPNSNSGTLSYGIVKENDYSRPSSYYDSKPNTHSNPLSYGNSGPNSYSRPSSYSGPESSGENSKQNTYSSTSSYSSPGSSYSSSKSLYPGSSSYSSPTKPHFDSSAETHYPNSDKYISHQKHYDQPDKSYVKDDYERTKIISNYERDPSYTPKSNSYKSGYSDSSPVTVEPAHHISYEDVYSSYSNTPHKELHNGNHQYISTKDKYSDPLKSSYETYPYNLQQQKDYSPISHNKDTKHIPYDSRPSKPNYGKKSYETSLTSSSYKPRSKYGSRYNTKVYESASLPGRRYPKKDYYNPLKPSYDTHQDPSSYEEPIKNYNSYPPSYKTASEVSYVPKSVSYIDNHPSIPTSKESYENTKHEDSGSFKQNIEDEYYSHDTYPKTSGKTYKSSAISSKPISNADSSQDDTDIPSSHYNSNSFYPTHSGLSYGSRYPNSYRKSRHTDSKTNHPTTSYFIAEDARSKDNNQKYENKSPVNGVRETHSYYHHYDDDSIEIPDNHSVKKNYSPVRPAPLRDQLEQPRYPPLPRRSKNNEKYYNSEEDFSKESKENYDPQSSYTATKSFNPAYNSDSEDISSTSYMQDEAEIHYPTSDRNKNYHYSDHSSQETDDMPKVYTKSTTTTYTKPYKDVTSNTRLYSGSSSDYLYKPTVTHHSKKNAYGSKIRDFVPSQPQYARPSLHRVLHKHSHEDARTKPFGVETKKKETFINKTLPITYSSLSEILPPKRVEGIVYRTRHLYPYTKSFRKQKEFLTHKYGYSKPNSEYDAKSYESLPSEVKEKNITKDRAHNTYLEKNEMKPRNVPPKINLRYISVKSLEYIDNDENDSLGSIPGEPGKDYPVLKQIPHNHFTCENKAPGFYADVNNRCQVYYQCSEEGRMQSFLCPNGTIFNQMTFVCEWWHNVDCAKSEKYFSKNNQLYKSTARSGKTKRTVKEKYVRPLRSEPRANSKFQTYFSEDHVV